MECYKSAFDALHSFYHMQDSIDMLIFSNRARSVEEECRYQLETQNELHRNEQLLWIGSSIIIFLVALIAVMLLVIRNNRSNRNLAKQREETQIALNEKLILEKEKRDLEAQDLERRLYILDAENNKLKEIIKKHSDLPKEVIEATKVRLQALNSILAHAISGNDKYIYHYEEIVKTITNDASEFMNSNRLAFQASHPAFIKYLKEHGLTIDEINYCCLYALGLRGKEIGNYMKMRSHVNISSAIRKKIGLERTDTNLGIYIQKRLNSPQ